jgi:hypothetical protein
VNAIARLAWDEHYLYLGYEIRNADLDGERDKLASAQFFLSLGRPTEFWEMQHTAGNEFSTHWCVVPPAAELRAKPKVEPADVRRDRQPFVANDGKHSASHAIEQLPNDAGFRGEIRLPWSGLGLPAERKQKGGGFRLSGLEMQVLSAVSCGQGSEARTWSSGELPGQPLHFSASRWPRFLLAKP